MAGSWLYGSARYLRSDTPEPSERADDDAGQDQHEDRVVAAERRAEAVDDQHCQEARREGEALDADDTAATGRCRARPRARRRTRRRGCRARREDFGRAPGRRRPPPPAPRRPPLRRGFAGRARGRPPSRGLPAGRTAWRSGVTTGAAPAPRATRESGRPRRRPARARLGRPRRRRIRWRRAAPRVPARRAVGGGVGARADPRRRARRPAAARRAPGGRRACRSAGPRRGGPRGTAPDRGPGPASGAR